MEKLGFTTEMAEENEKLSLLDALCDNCIELNDEFLNRFAGKEGARILKTVPESDRAFHLDGHIDTETSFFNGSPAGNCDNDIWLDVSEIEVQFEGEPREFFEDVNDWHIDGDLAYHYVGYGLTVDVDVEGLEQDIKDWNEE